MAPQGVSAGLALVGDWITGTPNIGFRLASDLGGRWRPRLRGEFRREAASPGSGGGTGDTQHGLSCGR
ncbi:MAG: hypothetical protein OXD46_14970 [Chloroflexi bacterium]|nr:hypothetical protein [Chloroflexota bacterium]